MKHLLSPHKIILRNLISHKCKMCDVYCLKVPSRNATKANQNYFQDENEQNEDKNLQSSCWITAQLRYYHSVPE